MIILAEILSSRVRAEIFRLLFGVNEVELHVREIERRSGLNISTVRQELEKLERLDLVIARRDGNRLYYRANRDHPLFSDIHNLVVKTSGLVDILREAVDKEGVKIAFVFGSIAGNQADAGSDVDLMVIGDVGLRTLSGWLTGISDKIEREVNPHVLSEEEFARKKQSKDHFLFNVLSSPKLFIRGSEDELAGLGG
jgi:DNA-binding transcriptional ArsR family regulator